MSLSLGFTVSVAGHAPALFSCDFVPSIPSYRKHVCNGVPGHLRYEVVRTKRRLPSRCAIHALSGAAVTSALAENVLVQIQTSSGALRLAKVLRPDGKRNWLVEDFVGASHSVSPKQVKYIVGRAEDCSPGSLEQLERSCHERARDNDELVQLVWETISADGGIDNSNVTDVESVAEIVFSEADPLTLYTTHLLLSNDSLYFKVKNIKGKVYYEARSESNLAAARLAEEAKQAKQVSLEKREQAFHQSLLDRSIQPLQNVMPLADVEQLIQCLKAIALEVATDSKHDSNSSLSGGAAYQLMGGREKDLVKEALDCIKQKNSPASALQVLTTWGILTKHENIAFLQAELPHKNDIDSELATHVDKLLTTKPCDRDAERRIDLSLLSAYAIDSADTTEVDDAISWDRENSRILIHIADPTRYFPDGLDHPVLHEAFRRVSTLYLPTEKYPMFPARLGSNLFSLDGVDSDGAALTIGFAIAEDGSLVTDSFTIETTTISAPLRYTYEQVDEIIDNSSAGPVHADLRQLHTLAEKRRSWREMEGGAMNVDSPNSEVIIRNPTDENPEIDLSLIDTGTASWMLVSELMIAACTVGAEMATKAGLPVAFRGQEPFDYPDDDVLESLPNGPVRAAVMFRGANPSMMDTKPMVHASLGLDAYVQITSPIRRTSDLIAHFQIKAHLRGEELPFHEDDVRREISRSSTMTRKLRSLENRTKKYWQLEYLRRLGPHVEHDGLYIRRLREDDNRLALVFFTQYGFQLLAQVPATAKPASNLRVRVLEAQPRLGMSKVTAESKFPAFDKAELSSMLDDIFSDVSSESPSEPEAL